MDEATFLKKQRELLADLNTSSPLFTTQTLNSWRDDEITRLYARGLFKRGHNIGTEIAVVNETPANNAPQPAVWYAVPSTFRIIDRVEFVDANGVFVEQAHDFNEITRPGFIRVDDALKYDTSYKIRIYGEQEYTAVTDSVMKAEVLDVVKYGSVLRALTSELVKRVGVRRSASIARRGDVSPGAVASGIVACRQLFKDALKDALAVQPRVAKER